MKTKNKPKKSFRHVIGFLLLLLSFPVFGQQQLKLTGKVSDKTSNQSIIGATVRVKGTLSGTTTDANGEFQIASKQNLPLTLIITFVGYETQEVDVYEAEALNIALQEDLNKINEVVIVGYGTQKKSDITGSLSSIPTSTLKQLPVSSFDKALQGVAAGVQVTQTSGQPGGVSSIRIRGGNSITSSNEPLYVIDGFPVYNDQSSIDAGALSGQGANPLSTISTNDIESIDVLKDASATAIYGSRGANGVVLITTKRGKSGETLISYDAYYGQQKISKTLDLLNAQQFAQLRNDAGHNTDSTKAPYYTQAQIAALKTTDWQNAIFRTAAIQSHNLSISGGDDKSHFLISGNYFNQDGILLNTGFERYSGRINYDRNVSKRFKVGSSLTASDVATKQARDGVVLAAVIFPPDVPIKDNTGKYTPINSLGSTVNPVASLNEETNKSNTFRFLGNIYGEYNITEGLVAKVSFGSDVLNTKQDRYLPSDIYDGNLTNGKATIGNVAFYSWLNENTLTYAKKLNDANKIEVLAGYTTQKWSYENSLVSIQNFPTDYTTYNSLQSGSSFVAANSGAQTDVLNSFLGRLNYSLLNKYLFTASVRADGHSVLGQNNKWGYFPSVAAAWNATSEQFVKQLLIISNLKIRGSAGATGNSQIPPYSSLSQISPYLYPFNNILTTGFSPSNISNPNLKWETTYQYNGGVDLGVFGDRITANFDAYYKKTENLLLFVPLPVTSGFQNGYKNLGSLENKGIEIYLTTQNFKSRAIDGFNWTTTISYSLNKSKILSLGGSQSIFPDGGNERTIYDQSILQVGQPVGTFYGYKFTGIDQYGRPTYKGETFDPSNHSLTAGTLDPNSRQTLGNAQPKFIGSIGNSFTYKNFDLNVFFQGVYGNKILNYLKIDLTQVTGFGNALTDVLNRWTPSNPKGTLPIAFEQQSVVFSDRYIEDGSFLRLKNLTLGYTIPERLSKQLGIKKLRFYVSAQNVYTWTKYSGYDPEVSRYQQNALFQGYDYGEYPNYRTYLGGINLTF